MPRTRKGAARNKARKRILREARGYYGTKSRHKQQAKNALMRAGCFARRDRRARKRDFRRLWITRLSAAARANGVTYSNLINLLKKGGIELNRKSLSELAIRDPQAFSKVVQAAKGAK